MTIRLTIEHDPDCGNPLTDNDGMWTLYSFCSRHINFKEPGYFLDEETGGWEADLRAKLEVGLAFWLDYYEHGQGAWSLSGEGTQCEFDTANRSGLLVWEHDPDDMGAKSVEDRAKDARGTLKEYNEWANGNCYGYSIHRMTKCDQGHEHEGELIDSCWGYIGSDHMFDNIRIELAQFPDEEIEVDGEAAWLADYESLTPERAT